MPEIFGYGMCQRCPTAVLNELLWKTRGLCAQCFRTSPVVTEIIAVTKDRERVRLTLSKRTPAERASRRRAKKRVRSREDQRDRRRLTRLAASRAQSALTRVLPDVYEVLLAEERAKLGLEPWTLDRCLTPHRVTDETMASLASYAAEQC